MFRASLLRSLFVAANLSCCAGTLHAAQVPSATAAPAATTGNYVLVGWSELGMHCMDGKDYSVFAVLPPYNTIHAQLLKRGEPPTRIVSNVTITYQSIADTTGSINTRSANKSNFWTYSRLLFQSTVPPEIGLAEYHTQNRTPHTMAYNATAGTWDAIGIPTMPYDDAGKRNAYSMVMLVAKDLSGNTLATADIVLPVSDEMSCKNCHASGASAAAMPKAGWVNSSDPLKDAKLNILKKHDDRWVIASYLPALAAKGWHYQSSLYKTAMSGTPVLCAACHSDNALSLSGLKGIGSLSSDMHRLHGPQTNPVTHLSLDKATTDVGACYLCHPGPTTKCKRGAMSTQRCSDCHGTTSQVGVASRNPWLMEPSCQMCHNTSQRFLTTFATVNVWRKTTDTTFATNANVPIAGSDLFRYSRGHGKLYCSACHGSPHAEFPTLQPNDNVYSMNLQGHVGKITECTVCHTNLPVSAKGGPHGMHTIGQSWVSAHGDYAERGAQACAYCHGASYRGSFLSKTSMARSFRTEGGTRAFAAGHAVSCYDCHNGPNGGD
jgi:hypothetical protein